MSKSDDPAWLLARAGLALRHHRDPAIREIGYRLGDWWWGGGTVPLEKLLGITTHGGVSLERAMKLRRRDSLIRGTWKAVPEWSDLPAARVARLMASDAKRYETIRWPRERDSISAPNEQPFSTWWEILQSGLPIPGAKQFQRILSRDIQEPV